VSAHIVNAELRLFKTSQTCDRGSRKTSAGLRQAAITEDQQRIEMLREEDREEVLAFLARRAKQTFLMTSWIMDNGITSPLNRGIFYGYRNEVGHLEGVALIGHVTLFETNNDDALMRFANLAQQDPSTNTLLGEVERVSRFLSHFTLEDQAPRLLNRERLFERREPREALGCGKELRLAVAADLDLIAPVHAQMAFEESGINPIFVDPEGFYQRCKRRIEQNRVWVSIEDGQLMFKADVISETPEVIYLEGVYVNPSQRRNGIAVRLLIDLTNHLLARANSVCLLANQENAAAIACYKKAGFKVRDLYDTVYLGASSSQRAR
jgi:ribosomal protein S18 acetylase RimI-like enzyme